jgi:hypothetical protein
MRLVILTRASGSGKTAIAEAIAAERPSLAEVLHFDRIGMPSTEEMLAGWGTLEAWQLAMIIEWMSRIAAKREFCRPVLFEGQMRLAAKCEVLDTTAVSLESSIEKVRWYLLS